MYGIFAVGAPPLGRAGPVLGCAWKPAPSGGEGTFGDGLSSALTLLMEGIKGVSGYFIFVEGDGCPLPNPHTPPPLSPPQPQTGQQYSALCPGQRKWLASK